MPALAVETSARTAATTTAPTPSVPTVARAASATGTAESATTPASVTPIMMATISTYSSVVKPSEPRIPRGMFLSGSSTSSAMLATFVTPA